MELRVKDSSIIAAEHLHSRQPHAVNARAAPLLQLRQETEFTDTVEGAADGSSATAAPLSATEKTKKKRPDVRVPLPAYSLQSKRVCCRKRVAHHVCQKFRLRRATS